MAEIRWCKAQKRGIRLIEPNDNLFEEYIRTAEETLDVLRSIKGKSRVWLATTKYYCEYFSVYALLMRAGIKCEIHDCTIALCGVLEDLKVVPQGCSAQLEADKQLRIDNQYYLKNRDVPIEYRKIAEFVFALKGAGIRMTKEQIEGIREKVKGA
jgi:uncharacterized protein (UPF0332 family)